MQRFVRGDTSRNTEGSGLGLSIAKSLTELQQGKFSIYLDGDLFKVTIEFEKKWEIRDGKKGKGLFVNRRTTFKSSKIWIFKSSLYWSLQLKWIFQ